jgi:hypothetical protein
MLYIYHGMVVRGELRCRPLKHAVSNIKRPKGSYRALPNYLFLRNRAVVVFTGVTQPPPNSIAGQQVVAFFGNGLQNAKSSSLLCMASYQI